MTTQQTDKTTATPNTPTPICNSMMKFCFTDDREYIRIQDAHLLEFALAAATAARLDAERKVAELRTALQDVSRRAKEFDDEDCPYAVMSYLRSISDRALSTTLGQNYVPKEELDAAQGKLGEMRSALNDALPALRMLENQFASSLSCDSRSHDEDRPWRKRINLLIKLAEDSTTPNGWKSPEEVRETERKTDELFLSMSKQLEDALAKLSELEREVEGLRVGRDEAVRSENDVRQILTITTDEADALQKAVTRLEQQRDTFRERCARLEAALNLIHDTAAYPKECATDLVGKDDAEHQLRERIVTMAFQSLAGSDGGEVGPAPVALAKFLIPPRKELCAYCNELVTDWVDPDWARGRICLPCYSKRDSETGEMCAVEPATTAGERDESANTPSVD
jgi:hypothetical protein